MDVLLLQAPTSHLWGSLMRLHFLTVSSEGEELGGG